jgi:hypothetical protein
MATNLPYTLQDIQDRINTLVSNDNDTPSSNDDEWGTRSNLIYQAIGNWESADVLWNELWTTYSGTALSGNTTYDIGADDFRFPGGYLRLVLNDVTNYVLIIKPELAQAYTSAGQKAVYFTGSNLDGRVLNLTWTPASGDGTYGATFYFDYYKYAENPSAVSDTVEMSDPNYIVYWVAAQKNLLESKNNQYSVYDGRATECFDNMRIMNDLLPEHQNNVVENIDALHGAILGE